MSLEKFNNKRIAKNTIYLFLRSIFLLLINLYTSRITLDVLGVEDYGIYNLVAGVVAMFTMISGTLSSASQRFITYALGEKDKDKLKKVFSTSVSLHIILAIIVSLLIEGIGIYMIENTLNLPTKRVWAAHCLLQFSIVTFFFNVISVPYNALITAHEKMSAFAYISIVDGVLKLVAAFYLYICGFDKLIIYGFMLMAIAVIIRIIYSVYSHRRFEESRNIKLRIEHDLFKEMFSFAGWNLLGEGSMLLRNQGVDILLNIFFGVTVNAAKGLANQIQHAITMLVGNFTTAVKPQLTKAVAQKDTPRIFFLINQGSRFSFYLLAIVAVPIIISTPDILSIWLKEVPQYTVSFVRWTLIYALLDTQSRFHIHAILSAGKIRNYQIIVGGTKLLAIPVAYVFLKCGASALIGIWVNIGLEIICFGERLYYNKKQLEFPIIQYVTKLFIPNWIVFIIMLSIPFIISYFCNLTVFLIIPISVLYGGIIIAFIGLKKNERIMLTKKVASAIKKRKFKKK